MTSHTATPSPMVLTTAGGADRTRRTATPSPMVYARIPGVLYLLNIQAPGNQSQLGNVATRTTFLASLLGFTGLFWWVYRLRVDLLGLRRRLQWVLPGDMRGAIGG